MCDLKVGQLGIITGCIHEKYDGRIVAPYPADLLDGCREIEGFIVLGGLSGTSFSARCTNSVRVLEPGEEIIVG